MVGDRHEVYFYYAHDGALLYVGCTARFWARHAQHRSNSHWFAQVDISATRRIVYPDKRTARSSETRNIRRLRPLHNVDQHPDGRRRAPRPRQWRLTTHDLAWLELRTPGTLDALRALCDGLAPQKAQR